MNPPESDVHHTWASYILPYMEEASLFGTVDFTIPSWAAWLNEGGGDNRPAKAPWLWTQLNIQLCPSDQPRDIHTGIARAFAHGSYLANEGWGSPWPQGETVTESTMRIALLNRNALEDPAGSADVRGPFQKVFNTQNKGIGLKKIIDGTSSTVMLGEVRQYEGEDCAACSTWPVACTIRSTRPTRLRWMKWSSALKSDRPMIRPASSTPAPHAARNGAVFLAGPLRPRAASTLAASTFPSATDTPRLCPIPSSFRFGVASQPRRLGEPGSSCDNLDVPRTRDAASEAARPSSIPSSHFLTS